MALDEKEQKQLTDLGAALASIQAEVEKLKTAPVQEPAALKALAAELAGVKEQIGKLTPAAPAKDAPATDWLDFLGLGWVK